MLAFTVQFSRYGRNTRLPRCIRDRASPGRSSQRPSKAAASSGPNSVLSELAPLPALVPLPRRGRTY